MGFDAGLSKKSIFAIVAVIVVIFVALSVFYSLNGHSLDTDDREFRIVVTGSMDGDPQPYEISTIPVNSMVAIKHLSGDELGSVEIGDVLAFQHTGRLTVHRVAEIYTGPDGKVVGFKTIGDVYIGTGHYETPSSDDVVGVVVGVSPIIGKVVHFAQTSTVYLIVILVLIAVMISVVRDMLRGKHPRD